MIPNIDNNYFSQNIDNFVLEIEIMKVPLLWHVPKIENIFQTCFIFVKNLIVLFFQYRILNTNNDSKEYFLCLRNRFTD